MHVLQWVAVCCSAVRERVLCKNSLRVFFGGQCYEGLCMCYVYMCMSVCVYVCVYICVYMYVCVYICIHVYVYMSMCMYMYIYMDTYMYIYVYVYMCSGLQRVAVL